MCSTMSRRSVLPWAFSIALAGTLGGAFVERVSAAPSAAPAEGTLADALAHVEIHMYTASWCGVCSHAKDYMRRQGIAFREYDIDRDRDAAARLRRLNPRGSVPTFEIGNETLVGFAPGRFESTRRRAAEKYMHARR